MYNTEEIIAKLRAGANPEDLAAEMADALNAATTALKEEEEEKAAAIRQERAKREAVAGIRDAFLVYLQVAGESDLIPEVENWDLDKVAQLLDGTILMAKRLEEIKTMDFPIWFF
jgi:hypothetical protein